MTSTVVDRQQRASTLALLSVHALRVELHRRRLCTAGMRPALHQRLAAHLAALDTDTVTASHAACVARRVPTFITVPLAFEHVCADAALHQQLPALDSATASHTPSAACGLPSLITVPPALEHVRADAAMPSASPTPTPTPAAVPVARVDETQRPKQPSCVVGVLRVRSVWVTGEQNMADLWRSSGSIGKGNLSRSAPCYSNPPAPNRRGRALRQLFALESRHTASHAAPRADVEHLQLSLVEAYYAAFVLHSLVLHDAAGITLNSPRDTWHLFCKRAAPHFAPTFVAYCHYRAAGWLPRSGLKYGVDWVLYKGDKRHTHSPFCVILRFRAAGDAPKPLDRTWVALQNRLRLVKNVSKALVIAEVVSAKGTNVSASLRQAFKYITITEVTIDRFVP